MSDLSTGSNTAIKKVTTLPFQPSLSVSGK